MNSPELNMLRPDIIIMTRPVDQLFSFADHPALLGQTCEEEREEAKHCVACVIHVYTVLTKRNFPPQNRQNTFFLLTWDKSFLHHCMVPKHFGFLSFWGNSGPVSFFDHCRCIGRVVLSRALSGPRSTEGWYILISVFNMIKICMWPVFMIELHHAKTVQIFVVVIPPGHTFWYDKDYCR